MGIAARRSRRADAPTASLKLFSPGWRGLGPNGVSVVTNFTEMFGAQDPASIHAVNPSAKSYKYTPGPYVTPSYVSCDLIPPSNINRTKTDAQGNLICGTNALPNSVIAKGSDNMAVYAVDYPDYFLVVPDDPAWINYIQINTVTTVTFSTNNYYDGMMSDSMGTAPVTTNYLNDKPINPNTGQLYTPAEWLIAENAMIDARHAGLPVGMKLMFNGLGSGARYWTNPISESPRAIMSDKVDGVMAELIFRGPESPLATFPSAASWLQDVTMIQDVENTYHKKGYWWTKCWSGETDVDLLSQWLRYTSSSYLLGAGPNSFFNFDTSKSDSNPAEFFADYDFIRTVGYAVAPMSQVGATGMYQRPFSNGLVVVNPTTASANVNLGATTYQDFDGSNRTGSFTVPSHTGHVLVKV